MSPYQVDVTPTAWSEIKSLPKKVRNRVKKFVTSLADNPRPDKTKALSIPDFQIEV